MACSPHLYPPSITRRTVGLPCQQACRQHHSQVPLNVCAAPCSAFCFSLGSGQRSHHALSLNPLNRLLVAAASRLAAFDLHAACLRHSILQNFAGQGLYRRLYSSFGQLQFPGYQGHRFPVVVGAIGSAFLAGNDKLFMANLGAWARGDRGTGIPHESVQVKFPIAWPANS